MISDIESATRQTSNRPSSNSPMTLQNSLLDEANVATVVLDCLIGEIFKPISPSSTLT